MGLRPIVRPTLPHRRASTPGRGDPTPGQQHTHIHGKEGVGVTCVQHASSPPWPQVSPSPASRWPRAAPAAAATTTTGGTGSGDEVEVFTWWASGSEKPASTPSSACSTTQNPDVTFVNGAVAGGAGSAAKDLLQTRLQANDPPDTFQAHAGAELTDYINAGQVEDVSALYDEFGLRDAFPADLVDRLTVDGKIYSIPSNIHRANVVWANTQLLTDSGLDPAATYATLDDWFVALDTVKEKTGRTPLSVGDHVDPGQPARDHPPRPTWAPTATTASGTGRPTGPAPRSPTRSRTSRSS